MACKPKHKDSLSNAKEVMMDHGAIDNWYNIRDVGLFRRWNNNLSNLATKYNVGALYVENDTSTRAIPNVSTFAEIDRQRKELGIYEDGGIKVLEDTTMEEIATETNETNETNETVAQGPHVISSPGLPDLYLTEEEYNCK